MDLFQAYDIEQCQIPTRTVLLVALGDLLSMSRAWPPSLGGDRVGAGAEPLHLSSATTPTTLAPGAPQRPVAVHCNKNLTITATRTTLSLQQRTHHHYQTLLTWTVYLTRTV